jgi:hypothetical protein
VKTKIKKFLIGLALTGFTLTAFASPASAPSADSNFVALYTAMEVLVATRQAINVTTTVCEGLKTDKDARGISTRDKNLVAFTVATGAWGVVLAFADANAKLIREFRDDIDEEYYEVSMEVIDSVRKLAKSIPPTDADVDDILDALSSADRKVNQLLKRLEPYNTSPSGRRSGRNL